MKKYHHYFILISFVFALQACSLKYIYNQLDWLVVTYIEDFVSLDEQQSELLGKKFQKTFNWHRDTQLKLYTNWLQKFRTDIDSSVNTKMVLNHFDIIKSLFINLVVRLTDDIEVLLPTLTESQITEILANLTNKNAEFADQYLIEDKEELQAQQQDDLIEKYQQWLGDLSTQQIILITTAVEKTEFIYQERYRIRLKWQKELSDILYQAKAGKDVQQEFKNLFLDYTKFRDKVTKAKFEDNKFASAELIVAISKTLSEEQKRHLFEKIDSYQTLFQELM